MSIHPPSGRPVLSLFLTGLLGSGLLNAAGAPPRESHPVDPALVAESEDPNAEEPQRALMAAAATLRDITATRVDHTDSAGNAFERWTLLKGTATTQGYNPSFVTIADINKDGYPDIVLSQFGPFNGTAKPGQVEILYGTGDLSKWKVQVVLPTTDKLSFPNRTTVVDVNGDGRLDILVAGGFLAASKSGFLAWYEQMADGSWQKHLLLSGRAEFYHSAVLEDVTGDGIPDLLAAGETAKTLFGGKNSATLYQFTGSTTSDRFSKTPVKLCDGGGSLACVRDVDGDGRRDLVYAQFFMAGESFAWLRNPGPTGTWTRQIMDTTSGPGMQIEWVDNLLGAGKGAFVGSNHTNTNDGSSIPESAVFLFAPPANPTSLWGIAKISTGIKSRKSGLVAKQMAPGVLSYGDVDGDGAIDITVSGDGDSRVFWLRNLGNGLFQTITLAGASNAGSTAEFGQCGGMNVVDFDHSGKNAIVVTSYEGNTLTVFKKKQ